MSDSFEYFIRPSRSRQTFMSIIIGSAQLKATQIDSKKTKWTHTRACALVCMYVHTNLLHPLCQCAPILYTFIEHTHTHTPLQNLLNFEAEQFEIVKVIEAIRL